MAIATRESSRDQPTRPQQNRAGRSLQPPNYGIGLVDAGLVQCSRSRAPIDEDPNRIRATASEGIRGPGGPLPYLERIQQSFGRYDVSSVVAHTGGAARAASRSIGAEAFATGNHVAFARPPSLHTAAHEAAHVVQQRGTVQLAGGVGRVGDAYERHADAVADQVVKGESAEATLAMFAGPSFTGSGSAGGGEGLVQRKELDLDLLGLTGDFVWVYIEKLIHEYRIDATVAKWIEHACTMLLDYGARLLDAESYLTVINPYLEALRAVQTVIDSIPEPVGVAVAYGIGWGIRKFSERCMRGAITESHINTLLIGGGKVSAIIGNVVSFLYDVGHNPVSAVAKAVWSAFNYVGITTARSFTDLFYGSATAAAPSSQAEPAKLVDANLGWFWVHVDKPKLGSWKKDGVDRGGLQLGARFGVKLFGEVLGADAVSLDIPYAGDWEISTPSVSVLSSPLEFGELFTIGEITLTKVRINQDGLLFAHLMVESLSFGGDTVTANRISLTYRADSPDDMLHIAGAAALHAFGHEVDGRIDLQIDAKGDFVAGKVDLEVPETFDLVEDHLALSNPKMWASWDPDTTSIGIGGDLEIKLANVIEFASAGTTLSYDSDEGFVGAVDRVWVNIPIHKGGILRFELTKGRIDSKGFHAGKLSLIYAYGDDALADDAPSSAHDQDLPEPGSKLDDETLGKLVPGFDTDWIKAAGLETLVIDLSAEDVDLSSSGFEIGALTKELRKFKAHLFGLGAEFDGKAGTGAITGGPLKHKVTLPALKVDFPIAPLLIANFGIRADAGFEVGLKATAARLPVQSSAPTIHPWKLGGTVSGSVGAGLQFEAGIGFGVPLLASINGGLFARFDGKVGVEGNVEGKVLWDDQKHALSLPTAPEDKPSATLTGKAAIKAEIGAQIRTQLLYFIDTELWSYRFLEWDLGQWSVSAKLAAKPDGDYELTTIKTGFGGQDGKPETGPIFTKARASVEEIIEGYQKNGARLTHVHEVWRLLHDLQDPSSKLPRAQKREYFAILKKLNATGEDLDAMSLSIIKGIEQRTEVDSLLMSGPEWVLYSTTLKALSDKPTVRKSITDIDDAVAAYHEAATLPKRKAALAELLRLIPIYLDQSGLKVSRKDMVEKLRVDAQRELARISG
ncbi:DUF4157 domain-containing protein [Nannocystaceae bacterium ST9]